jgi:hypothetical protein
MRQISGQLFDGFIAVVGSVPFTQSVAALYVWLFKRLKRRRLDSFAPTPDTELSTVGW